MEPLGSDPLNRLIRIYREELKTLWRRLPRVLLPAAPFAIFLLASGVLLKACSGMAVIPPLVADRIWEMPADADQRELKNLGQRDRICVWTEGPVKRVARVNRRISSRERKSLEEAVDREFGLIREDRFSNLLGTRLVRFYEKKIAIGGARVNISGSFLLGLLLAGAGILCYVLGISLGKLSEEKRKLKPGENGPMP